MTQSKRIRSLDRLRAFVVLLVIVLHASVTYMVGAPEWWYVVEGEGSRFFTALVLLIDVPIMPAMFFVAGYFALPSLLRRGPQQFARDKLWRIGLPWVLGVLFLAPPITYLTYLSRGIGMGLLQFWRTDFWGEMYQQTVYWFLGVLLALFLAVVVFYDSQARRATVSQQPATPSAAWLAGFVALTTAAFLLLNQYFPLDTWLKLGYVWVVQPLRVPLYIAYFGLGVYAYRHAWFVSEGFPVAGGRGHPAALGRGHPVAGGRGFPAALGRGFQPRLDAWALWCAASGTLYVSYRLTYPPTAQTTLALQAANAALFNVFCFCALMAGIALFGRQTQIAAAMWTSLAASSYGMYYVHPLFVYPLAYIFRSLSFPLVAKAFVVIVLSILLSWACSALLLRRAPVLRRMFSGSD